MENQPATARTADRQENEYFVVEWPFGEDGGTGLYDNIPFINFDLANTAALAYLKEIGQPRRSNKNGSYRTSTAFVRVEQSLIKELVTTPAPIDITKLQHDVTVGNAMLLRAHSAGMSVCDLGSGVYSVSNADNRVIFTGDLPETSAFCRGIEYAGYSEKTPATAPNFYTFASTVKPLNGDDFDALLRLPNPVQGTYTLKEKSILNSLYHRYVEPVLENAQTMYAKKAEPLNGKQPTIPQSQHFLLNMYVDFLSKGEIKPNDAADFFYAALDSTEPYREFIRAFYTND